MNNLQTLLEQALSAVTQAETVNALEQVRVQFLGKKGEITEQLKNLGKLPPEQRRDAGAEINRVKDAVQEAL
ncbi:phenylalanine--tRNA ligase subunit alpha, partial [Arthrospira platensis SPKY1]|nr:phenylalanine--tRNA ligase subunit alpha [Arthrospira platensis SPKY1]